MLQIIPPASMILILYVFFSFRKRSVKKIYISLFTATLALEMTTSMGYFVKIGSFDVSLCNGASLFALVFALILLIKERFDKRILCWGCAFFACALVGLFLYKVYPYKGNLIADISYWDLFLMKVDRDLFRHSMDKSSIMGLINLTKWIILLSVAKYICNKEPQYTFEILDGVANYSVIPLGYDLIEFLSKNIFAYNTTPVMLSIFGVRDAQFDGSLIRGNSMQKMGFFTETSFYTYGLFLLCLTFLILLNHYKSKKGNRYKVLKILFVVSLVLLVFSFSFFVIIAVPLLFVAYLVLMKDVTQISMIIKQVVKATVIIIAGALLLVGLFRMVGGSFYDYYSERVIRTLRNLTKLGNIQTGYVGLWSSETTRLTSVVECLKIFVSRPIFGVGISITDCHSTVVALLSTMGLLGFVCWIAVIKNYAEKINIMSLLLIVATFFLGGGGMIFGLSFGVLSLGFNELQSRSRLM